MIDIKDKMREFGQLVEERGNKGVQGYLDILEWIGKFKGEMGQAVLRGDKPHMPADMLEPLSQTLRETALKGLMRTLEQVIEAALLRVAGVSGPSPASGRKWSCER